MLFTDSDIVSSADLMQLDSEVVSVVASTKPQILMDGPGSVCEQAWRECGRRIGAAQQTYTATLSSIGISGGHQSAVSNIGGPARNITRTRMNQIVATETQYAASASSIQIWMGYAALSLLFRDASARLGKDRLQDKYDRYVRDADFAWRQLRQNGLPFISTPIEAPGAKHGANAGIWSVANLSTVAGSGTAQTLQVAVTYYDASKYVSEANTGNAESGPSAVLGIAQPVSTVLKVSIASLIPPTGIQDPVGLSGGSWTPLTATHWIVWAGQPGQPLYWQAAVPIATKTFTLAGDPVLSGSILGSGQFPEILLTFMNVVGRG